MTVLTPSTVPNQYRHSEIEVAVVTLNQPAQNEVRLILFGEEGDEFVTTFDIGAERIRTHLTRLCAKYRFFDLFENRQ